MVDPVFANILGPGHSHDSMPSGAGSTVALPCHMVRSVEGVGARLPGTSGREAWGISAENHD